MIKKGDELSVSVIDISSEGKGISKLEDGFVIFSSGTLPGDNALIKISKKKSAFGEGKLLNIITPSIYRKEPECSYFGVCGGCKIQHYDYAKQLEFKSGVVSNSLERIGGFKGTKVPETLKCNEIFFYRNKMEFSFSDDEWLTSKDLNQVKEKFALGLHVPKFHSKIINIHECLLQSGTSNDILNLTREFFKKRKISVYSTNTHSGFLRFLIIRQSKNTDDLMVNLITFDYNEELMKEYSDELRTKIPEISTLINSVSQKKAQVATGESEKILFGSGFIYEKLFIGPGSLHTGGYLFKISPQSFFQTNTLQAQELFKVAVNFGEFNKGDSVLDLYCGAGSISIFVSGLVKKVHGVEISEDAIRDAIQNSKLNNVQNTEFTRSDIKEFLEDRYSVCEYNKLILDPPRSGLHPKICEVISRSGFEKIIYVSCNPQTQARDLSMICSKGIYEIERVQPVDMFPHTYHIENVVSLKRSETNSQVIQAL